MIQLCRREFRQCPKEAWEHGPDGEGLLEDHLRRRIHGLSWL